MPDIQPQKKQNLGTEKPFQGFGQAIDFFKKVGSDISSAMKISTAQTMADQAQTQAEKVAQQLANKTGKAVNVDRPTGVDTSKGNVPAIMTQADLEKMHADSVAKFGQKPNAPVVPTVKTTAPAKPTDSGTPADTTPPVSTGTTTAAASTSAVSSGTKTDPNSDAVIPPSTTPPPGSTAEQAQAFYDANPFIYRPGETIDAYNARVSSAGGSAASGGSTKTYDASGDFISPADQSSIAAEMKKSADLSSGGSALAAFSDATATATGDSSSTGSIQSEIEAEMNDIMTQFSTPPASQQKAYNDLIASSGLNDDQKKALDLKTIMDGTVDDVRAGLTNNGGFATESQIQALASARNVNLSKQYNLLQDGITTKQKWIDDKMKYMGADQQEADTQFEKKYSLINNLQSTLARLQATDATTYYRFQTQQMSKLKTLLTYGQLSPDQISAFSASTGIDPTTLANANASAASRYGLVTAIDNSNLALKQMTLAGGGGKISSSQMTSLTLHQVPPQVSQYIYQHIAQGTSLEDIRTTLSNQYGKDVGYGYLDTFADVTGMNKGANYTASNIPSDVKSQLSDDISSGKYTVAQLVQAYPEVASTYITSLVTGQMQ